jgi:antitoxin (DNA-binding transcriptional repressor) of toxin-antitoxin stability system
MVVSLKEAQEKLPELFKEAMVGNEVVITNDDGVTAKLTITKSAHLPKRDIFGSMKGVFKMSDDFDAPLLEEEKAIYGDDA